MFYVDLWGTVSSYFSNLIQPMLKRIFEDTRGTTGKFKTNAKKSLTGGNVAILT